MKSTARSILFFVIFVMFNFDYSGLIAQNNLIPLSKVEVEQFSASLMERSAGMTSLESPFIQEKLLQMFNKKMVSTGNFRFKREDKLEFSYQAPMKYRMVINGTKLKIDNGGKVQIISLNNNPVVKEMKLLIQASFLGRLQELDNSYSITYFRAKDGSIVVEVIPKVKSVSDMIKKITVTFDPHTVLVSRLKLEEGAQGITTYSFTKPQINTIKNDENFSIN